MNRSRRLLVLGFALCFTTPATADETEAYGIPPGFIVIEGDIVVPRDFYETLEERGCYAPNLWPSGVVPYEFDPGVTAPQQAGMLDAMAEWEAVAGVDFRARGSEADYIYIKDDPGNWSFVGMQGDRQEIGIFNWGHRFIMAHELGHALGLWHEQSRTDRDTFVQIIAGNIVPGKEHNFDIVPTSTTHGDYDFDSVMHYGQCAFSDCAGCPDSTDQSCTDGGVTILVLPPWDTAWQDSIGQYDHLSSGDQAAMAFLYSSVNTAPVLSFPQVLPSSGQADATVFEFFVHYYDADGDPPHESYRNVYISGGHGGTMTRVSGSASDGTYRYATTLPAGSYIYSYMFCDGTYQCDQTAWLDGPSVYSPDDVPIQFNIEADPRTTCLELQYSVEGLMGDWEDLPVDHDQIEIVVPAGSEFWINGGQCCASHECDETDLYVNGSHIGTYDCLWGLTLEPFVEYVEIDVSWIYHPELTYQVAGTVLLSGGAPVPGGVLAVLTSSQEEQTQVTTDGTFFFDAQGGVPVSVAFSAAGYAFNPPILTFPDHCDDETGLEVTARSGDVLVPTVYLDTVPPPVTVTSAVSFTWIGQDDVSDPANLQYQYMLHGYDADWSSWSGATSTGYDLPNGVYTFVVTVRDEEENENAAPESYTFVVNAAPQVTNTERISRSVWATRVALYMPPGASHPTDVVVLLPEHAPDANGELVPVKIYDSEATLVGANEIVVSILGLPELPASLSEADQGWILTLPAPVSGDATVQYDIVWGNVAYFGWKPFVTLPDGFPNGRNGGYVDSAYLDENLTAWRLASKTDYQGTGASCDDDGWVFEDAVFDYGVLMPETVLRYVPGECWGDDTGTCTDFWGRRTFQWASYICSSWHSEKYTYDGVTDFYEDGFGFSCFDPDGPPFLVSLFDSSYYDRASISLPRGSICDFLWVATYHWGGPDDDRAWLLAVDNDGTEVVPKTFFEDFQHPNYHGLSSLRVQTIGAGVLLLWERCWDTDNDWERRQILYQIRDCAGDLVVGTTVLTPVEPDSAEMDDEYDIEFTLSDQSGKVWVSYEHDSGVSTEYGYLILSSDGGIETPLTQTSADREFRYCDRDGYIWAHEDGNLVVLNDDDTVYLERTAAYYPTQDVGLIAAAVEQSGTGYRLYDRWSPQHVSIDVPASTAANSMDLFDLNLWDNDLRTSNLTLDIDGTPLPFPTGTFTGYESVDVSGLLGEGLHLLTMTQDDFLGGQVLVTFPYRVCEVDEQCNDEDLCTVDTCDTEANLCVFTPKDCGEQLCDPDTGECVDCVEDTDCDDEIDCTVDSCAPETHTCEYQPDDNLCADPDYPECEPECGGCRASTGACCLQGRGCLQNQTKEFCEDTLVGVYACGGSECTDDPPPCDFGACCLLEACNETFRVECEQLGGDFMGPGEPCSSCPGACCQPNGSCEEQSEPTCSGQFMGIKVPCDPNPCLGACCVGDACVENQTEDTCSSVSGDWQEYGTDCDPNPCVEACCYSDGTCEEVRPANCTGTPLGEGTTCDPNLCTGACCTIGDLCVSDQNPDTCGSVSGQWAGWLTTCPPDHTDLCPICDSGDWNGDGDVDLEDFADFQICYERTYEAACKCVDMDNDFDVDPDDYALFQQNMAGPFEN